MNARVSLSRFSTHLTEGPKIRRACALCVLVPILATGCIPEKRIAWSPDGSVAAVFSENGIWLIDGQGTVLPPRFGEGSTRGRWFQDGRHLAVVHQDKARTWADVQTVLSKEEVATVRSVSEDAIRRLTAFQGDLRDFEFDPSNQLSSGLTASAIVYLRETHAKRLEERLGAQWDDLRDAEPAINRLSVVELANNQFVPKQTLVSTLDSIHLPLPSPDGAFVAYAAAASLGGDARCLWIVPAGGGTPRVVARNVSAAYDWSGDGRALVLVRASGEAHAEGSLQLGTLATLTLRDENGALLPTIGEPEDKAGLIYNDAMTVAWLNDGRILFSSVELTLPSTSHDMPQRWGLFAYDPHWQATIVRVTGRGFVEPLDLAVPLFDLSPDETRVVMSLSGGRAAIYHLQTGETTPIGGAAKGKTRALPTWRDHNSISFVAPGGEGELPPAQVMLWESGQTRTLSEGWSGEMREGWLTDKDQ